MVLFHVLRSSQLNLYRAFHVSLSYCCGSSPGTPSFASIPQKQHHFKSMPLSQLYTWIYIYIYFVKKKNCVWFETARTWKSDPASLRGVNGIYSVYFPLAVHINLHTCQYRACIMLGFLIYHTLTLLFSTQEIHITFQSLGLRRHEAVISNSIGPQHLGSQRESNCRSPNKSYSNMEDNKQLGPEQQMGAFQIMAQWQIYSFTAWSNTLEVRVPIFKLGTV